MNTDDRADLAAHALGLLSGDDARAVEDLIAADTDARREWESLHATATALRDVPPEFFIDGPPESDLLVRRAVRAVRAEGGGARRRRRFALAAAAAGPAAALLGGGTLIGRAVAPDQTAVVAGTQTVEGTQGPVAMTATITPAAGWVRVSTAVRGIEPGKRCTIIVLGGDGTENVAGSWVVGSGGGGATIEGSTIVDPAAVVAVAIRDETGTDLITLPV